MMTDCDDVEPSLLDTWYHVNIRGLMSGRDGNTYGHLRQVIEWLDSQEGGQYYWTLSGNIWFEREEDRTFCVLTWR